MSVYPYNAVNVWIQNFPLDVSGNLAVRKMLGNEAYGWVTSGGAAINNTALNANGISDTITLPIGVRNLTITINISAVSGTSPTIQFTLYYVDPVQNIAVPYVSTSTISTTGAYYIQATQPPTRWFKVGWTVGGTSPSFTTSISYYAWL